MSHPRATRPRTVRASAAALSLSLSLAAGLACQGEPGRDPAIEEQSSALIARSALIQRWAPIHYQDVNKGGGGKSLNGKADYVLRFDYEPASNAGDHWNSWDKWDNLGAAGSDLAGYVYADASESPTHWFIYYKMYHPRDWSSGNGQEHENDTEGALLFVRKDGSQFGQLEGMLTQAHGPMIPFTATPGTVIPKNVPFIEAVEWETRNGVARPRTYQEAEGHGMYGCGHRVQTFDPPGSFLVTKCDKTDEDGIRYVPDGFAQSPGTVGVWSTVSYAILSIGEFWDRRPQPLLFNQSNGKYNGNESGGCGDGITVTCVGTAANPMWQWSGNLATDPAAFVSAHFTFSGVTPPSNRYVKNDYGGCEDLTRVKNTPGHTSASCIPECSGAILAADPFCGDVAWDQLCVNQVETVCGIQISN